MKSFRAPELVRTAKVDQTSSELDREWIVTNGLGGYASGTIAGLNTRRFHGWLVAALPAPRGRMMMLNQVEILSIQDRVYRLTADDLSRATHTDTVSPFLKSFRLENGLPVFTYAADEFTLEKRLCMAHLQNTTYITYRLIDGKTARLQLRPGIDVRPHEGLLAGPNHEDYRFSAVSKGYELSVANDIPLLRLAWLGLDTSFRLDQEQVKELRYRVEQSRGYDWKGNLWSPGCFSAELKQRGTVSLVVSTEDWERVSALAPGEAFAGEAERRRRLLRIAPEEARTGLAAELVLAAGARSDNTPLFIYWLHSRLLLFRCSAPRRRSANTCRGCCRGELIGAYALSETGSGSDALGARTQATRQPDGSFLAQRREDVDHQRRLRRLFIVFAKVDGEQFTAFIVERGFGGVTSGKEEHKMGLHGSSTTPLILQDVKVPAENVLGEIGKGHKVAFNVLNFGRFKLGAMCGGGAQGAIGEAAKYAAQREAVRPADRRRSARSSTSSARWSVAHLRDRKPALPHRRPDRRAHRRRRRTTRPTARRRSRRSRSSPSRRRSPRSPAARRSTSCSTRTSRSTAATATCATTRPSATTATRASTASSKAPTRSTGC